MSSRPQGFGQEAFGDPFGAGGPLYVVRARAIEGQTVRVVFDEEPIHVSAMGLTDALNPNNYLFAISAGQATAPQAVGVKTAMVAGPAAGVAPGDERGFDVQVDRQLVVGLVYLVTAQNILAAAGGALGVPLSATFPGIVRLKQTLPPNRILDLLDFANDPFQGNLRIDTGGDIALQGGIEGLRKRIFRRLATPFGAFRFLPTYGVGLKLKQPASVRNLGSIRASIVQQLKLEPEVADVGVTLVMQAVGALTVTLRVKTKKGALLELTTVHSPGGGVVLV